MSLRETEMLKIIEDTLNMRVSEDPLGRLYFTCPGQDLHTGKNARKDTQLFLSPDKGGAPTIHCMHSSCSEAIATANHSIRSAIAKRETFLKFEAERSFKKSNNKTSGKSEKEKKIPWASIPEVVADVEKKAVYPKQNFIESDMSKAGVGVELEVDIDTPDDSLMVSFREDVEYLIAVYEEDYGERPDALMVDPNVFKDLCDRGEFLGLKVVPYQSRGFFQVAALSGCPE